MSIVAERLRKAREWKNLKQIQVKEKTGINNKTLSGYEKGVSEPDLETLKILANTYEVSIDWVSGHSDNSNTNNVINDEEARDIIEDLYKLPEDKRQLIKEIIKSYRIDS